jgi:hypothetical protein
MRPRLLHQRVLVIRLPNRMLFTEGKTISIIQTNHQSKDARQEYVVDLITI